MPQTVVYTPQEADIWNQTFSIVWVERVKLGDDDDAAAMHAIVAAGRAVEALRRAQTSLGGG